MAVVYQPNYSHSYALVIGINKYAVAGPLDFATNDANAVADMLIKRFGFPAANVTLLLDRAATRNGIMQAFLRYTDEHTIGPDDRLLVFFCGSRVHEAGPARDRLPCPSRWQCRRSFHAHPLG